MVLGRWQMEVCLHPDTTVKREIQARCGKISITLLKATWQCLSKCLNNGKLLRSAAMKCSYHMQFNRERAMHGRESWEGRRPQRPCSRDHFCCVHQMLSYFATPHARLWTSMGLRAFNNTTAVVPFVGACQLCDIQCTFADMLRGDGCPTIHQSGSNITQSSVAI